MDCDKMPDGRLELLKSNDSLTRLKKIFYDHGADAKIEFSDEKVIKVNKGLLGSKSPVFYEIFFGEPQRNDYYVYDLDSAAFKIFLDCLMGFKSYTVSETLLIFPIACTYQTDELLKNCVRILTPTSMNDTVCETLNLALHYDCQELVDKVINFLQNKCMINVLLEFEKYSSILDPIAVAKLLENVEMDFYLVKIIYNWAKNYLEKFNEIGNIRSKWLLKKHKILDKMSEISFDSVKSILDFCKFNETANLFTSEQVQLKHTFNVRCRILKTTPDPTILDKDKSLFFTYDISGCEEVVTVQENKAVEAMEMPFEEMKNEIPVFNVEDSN